MNRLTKRLERLEMIMREKEPVTIFVTVNRIIAGGAQPNANPELIVGCATGPSGQDAFVERLENETINAFMQRAAELLPPPRLYFLVDTQRLHRYKNAQRIAALVETAKDRDGNA